MYKLITQKLKEREKPINVAIVGCGWYGSGVAKELHRIPGMLPKVLINRTIEKAVAAFLEMGINKNDIAVVHNSKELSLAQNSAKYIAFSDFELIKELKGIDVIFEATGNILAGAKAALDSIEAGIHFVTINSEMDATIGLRLANLAAEKGIVYSNSDGDQPGCLARMLNEVIAWGFEPRIVGNCKEFFDMYQTPLGVKPFVPKGQDAFKICSYTDGTKQSFELAVVGNAFGYHPLKRGMYGPRTLKKDLIKTFDDLVNLKSLKGGHIEYTLGTCEPNQGGPVFIIACSEDPRLKADMKLLKKGEGPHYLFFRDHHLCSIETPSTIAEVDLFNIPTLSPKGRYVDAVAIAKRDLKPGQKLDGIGGYDCYGVVERADITAKESLLPIGLVGFATVKKKIPKDTPITYDMVDVSDSLIVKLRKEQDQLPLH
ncbi:hypothetical protein KY361_01440 [Candidatus Woesearchaeota archaeon]|nr:hypothetical protein [Candidatus Woesearchaeota archaeon]